MNRGRTIFAQVMQYIPHGEFARCVEKYDGERYAKSFSCMDQYLCMAFAQLTYREGLRDIESCLRAHQSKLYHMGMRATIARSTLAHANEHRDWRIWADFAQVLIREARELYLTESFGVDLAHTTYAFDSTTIASPNTTARHIHSLGLEETRGALEKGLKGPAQVIEFKKVNAV